MPSHDESGLGVSKTISGRAVRIVANNVTSTKFNSVRITGLQSGATWIISFGVNPGDRVFTVPGYPPGVLSYYEENQ